MYFIIYRADGLKYNNKADDCFYFGSCDEENADAPCDVPTTKVK